MSKYVIHAGINYAGTKTSINHDFEANSAHQCGAIVGKLVEDEPDAVNLMVTIVLENKNESDP